MALTSKLSAIGDAIRARTGGSKLLTLDEMPNAIAGIGEKGYFTTTVTVDAIGSGASRQAVYLLESNRLLAGLRDDPSLLLVVECNETVSGSIKSTVYAGDNRQYLPLYSNSYDMASRISYQSVMRITTDGVRSMSGVDNAISDDSNFSVGVGRLFIDINGGLLLLNSATGYNLVLGDYRITALWDE